MNPGPGIAQTINTQIPQTLSGYPQGTGNNWLTLGQSAIPMYVPGSGTLSASGALSGITAFTTSFINCYLYFPAGAIGTGSQAGMYFAQLATSSTGTVYQNQYLTGLPTIPSVLIPCTSASSYTQTTATSLTVATFTLPGNSMGPNGKVRITATFQNTAGANTKTNTIVFGGNAVANQGSTSNQSASWIKDIYNRGATNIQTTTAGLGFGTGNTGGNTLQFSVDTTQPVAIQFQSQLNAVATEWAGLDSFCVEVLASN